MPRACIAAVVCGKPEHHRHPHPLHTPSCHTPSCHTPSCHTPSCHTPSCHTPSCHTPSCHAKRHAWPSSPPPPCQQGLHQTNTARCHHHYHTAASCFHHPLQAPPRPCARHLCLGGLSGHPASVHLTAQCHLNGPRAAVTTRGRSRGRQVEVSRGCAAAGQAGDRQEAVCASDAG
jgi:hypothetical protein